MAIEARDNLAKHICSYWTAASTFVRRTQTWVANTKNSKIPRSCCMKIQDCKVSLNITGRCDHGNDVSLAPKKVAEQGILFGIGKLYSILIAYIKATLKLWKEDSLEKSRFSKAWIVPTTVVNLSAV